MKKEYKVLGAWCLGMHYSLELLAIDHYAEKALTRYTDGRKVWSKIRQTAKGRQYIRRGGCRYYFNDCMAIMD